MILWEQRRERDILTWMNYKLQSHTEHVYANLHSDLHVIWGGIYTCNIIILLFFLLIVTELIRSNFPVS